MYDQTGDGGADQQWLTITLYLYNIGWGECNFGRAAALAWILFLIILVIGLINLAHHATTGPRRRRPRSRQHRARSPPEGSPSDEPPSSTPASLAIVEEEHARTRPRRRRDQRTDHRSAASRAGLLGLRGPRRRHRLGDLPATTGRS